MDRQTAKIFRIKCIMKRCREKQRWELLAKMCYKYNMQPVNEAYYD